MTSLFIVTLLTTYRNHIMHVFSSSWSRTVLLMISILMPLAAETVTAIYPSSGVINVATTVVITGTGFAGTPVVTIAGTAATGVTVDSATQITATITHAGPLSRGQVIVGASSELVYFTVRQSTTATLQVSITCSIAQVLALCWTNTTGVLDGDTAAVPWPMTNILSGSVHDTDPGSGADSLNFEVRNVGNGPVHISVSTGATSTSAAPWTCAATAGVNTYALAVSDGANVVTPTWQSLVAAKTLNSGNPVAVNGTAPFDLRFSAPTWDTSLLSQAIDVSVVAAP